jgi:hypothetical protein
VVSVFCYAVFIKLGSLKEPCYIIMLTMSNFGFNYFGTLYGTLMYGFECFILLNCFW